MTLLKAVGRLSQRVENTAKRFQQNAILIFDEGNEPSVVAAIRRMRRYNPVPSAFGIWWDTGAFWKNMPLTRIIEDPFFKDSRKSFFIQMADWCAYALLRHDNPTPKARKYGLHQAFPALQPILFLHASYGDPYGVVRK